jgi:glycosyl-4,4'-diaponeurosporenoate acyltransferase
LFFTWNPWQIALLMVPYAVATNVPCIVAQRYNRPRLSALARRGLDSSKDPVAVRSWKQRTRAKERQRGAGPP